MTYGLGTRAFVENGPVEPVAKLDRGSGPARAWRALNDACRLEMIERALRAANDRIDSYPIAL